MILLMRKERKIIDDDNDDGVEYEVEEERCIF